jgi:hypothetical protein
MKLTPLLQEILKETGDQLTKPYQSEIVIDDENDRKYNFQTESTPPTYYEVDLTEYEPENPFSEEGILLDIQFGVTNEEGDKNMNLLTGKGELYRVMSTVISIVKKDIAEHKYIKRIQFTPAARKGKDTSTANARGNIYLKYVKAQWPKATEEIKDGKIIINLFG